MRDLRERLKKQGIHTLLVQFTDLHGAARGRFVPLAHLDDVLTDGAGFAGPAIWGSALPRTGERARYHARGQASSIVALPWLPGVARIVADGFVAGEPFDADPRQVLRRALAPLEEQGWMLRVGLEPEFFLLRREGESFVPADARERLDKPCYDLKTLPRQAGYLHELREALERCGLDVMQLEHAEAPGQYEVNFGHTDALACADQLMLFKQAAHAIAQQHDMLFSLMPKPFADQAGSDMHVHVSLWEGEGVDARSLFTPHLPDGAVDRTRTLSTLGRHFVAGVLAHSAALCALAAPTVNSYKRLRPTLNGPGYAPKYVAQGPDNRTALVRTLHGRFEWRLPDASANPYLMLAGMVAAGLDGIERRLDPGPDVDIDLLEASPQTLAELGLRTLPHSLAQALDALEGDEVLVNALSSSLVREFVRLKRQEWAEYARHVSAWELLRYVDAF
ncbi:glutamine synthetase family protein [Azohydromonas caseinilytica]|uniref:Type III glutamate--ammonia ligase n=1 Tax=Azohydromonas caseinilytica TaxID=2728836 RepID=A0A848FGJ0_9BURK|nr:glutamine synthetase family protein [Azohydromonas caseinilytica]NML17419.1 type III glutamate--ammonia ligase [Azohydromonas caseinilytica]